MDVKQGMRGPAYTEKETSEMVEMLKRGATYKEIAEMLGRSYKSVACKCRDLGYGIEKVQTEKKPETETPVEVEGKTLVRQKTLDDFTVREIIKNLYDRGCRIKNNKVYMVIEKEVKLHDII